MITLTDAFAAVIIAALAAVAGAALFGALLWLYPGDTDKPANAKTETLSCIRVKEVTPAGTIKYYCEVRK